MEREKITKSGKLLEVDFYPVWDDGRRMPTRPPKKKQSTAAQEKYNHQQAVKKTIRVINANFDESDYFMTLTYDPDKAPQNYEEACRDITNGIRRIKTKRASELKLVTEQLKRFPKDKTLQKRHKKLSAPFKYYIAIEEATYKTGKLKGRSNWHFHVFITGGIDRDTLEDMWPNGLRTNVKRYQPEKFGPEAAARYIAKDTQGRRRFRCSKNMTRPDQRHKDGKISRRGVEAMAKLRADDAAFWEKRYKGYRFIRCFPRYNEYNSHWYVSVIMYKAGADAELPEWKIDDWLTE